MTKWLSNLGIEFTINKMANELQPLLPVSVHHWDRCGFVPHRAPWFSLPVHIILFILLKKNQLGPIFKSQIFTWPVFLIVWSSRTITEMLYFLQNSLLLELCFCANGSKIRTPYRAKVEMTVSVCISNRWPFPCMCPTWCPSFCPPLLGLFHTSNLNHSGLQAADGNHRWD